VKNSACKKELRKKFFSEELAEPARREPRDFYVWLLPHHPAKSRIDPWAPEAKVFWFFSSEKNILRPFPVLPVNRTLTTCDRLG
jgi:hypothetical protein